MPAPTGSSTADTFAAGITLTNAGTIGGSVVFDPGAGNRVVVDPTGVFLGTLDGGNPVGSADTSVLELAGGASTGTLNGLGTQFTDFGQVTVDAGASWYLTNDSFAAGMTLTNAGTLSGPGGTAAVFGAGRRQPRGDRSGRHVRRHRGRRQPDRLRHRQRARTGRRAASTRALSGIGTQFTNFSQITVDAGAYWSLTGSNTIAPGATLTVSGELANNGTLIRQRHPGRRHDPERGRRHDHRRHRGHGRRRRGQQCRHHRRRGRRLPPATPNLVVLYPDAVFGGTVNGGGPSGVLELGAYRLERRDADRLRHEVYSASARSRSIRRHLEHRRQHPRRRHDADQRRHGRGLAGRGALRRRRRQPRGHRPGGTFSGIVDGGNALGSATASTLELTTRLPEGALAPAHSAAWAPSSSISPLIAVDSGATWGVDGSNTIAAAATLSVSGYLSNYGTLLGNVTLGGSGELRNNTALVDGAVIGTGAGVALRNFGTILADRDARRSVSATAAASTTTEAFPARATACGSPADYGAVNNQAQHRRHHGRRRDPGRRIALQRRHRHRRDRRRARPRRRHGRQLRPHCRHRRHRQRRPAAGRGLRSQPRRRHDQRCRRRAANRPRRGHRVECGHHHAAPPTPCCCMPAPPTAWCSIRARSSTAWWTAATRSAAPRSARWNWPSNTPGVLSGLGSKYIDFGQIIVDPGASGAWAAPTPSSAARPCRSTTRR